MAFSNFYISIILELSIRQAKNANKRPRSLHGTAALNSPRCCLLSGDLGDRRFAALGLTQHIAAAPDGLDIILAVGRHAELLAPLSDEDVDDLELGLVHPAIQVVEEHFLGERRALAQREQLQHRTFLD